MAVNDLIDELLLSFIYAVGEAREKVVNEPWFGEAEKPAEPSFPTADEVDPAAKDLCWDLADDKAWMKWKDVELDPAEPEQPELDPQLGIDR